jgi:hypothetical protein
MLDNKLSYSKATLYFWVLLLAGIYNILWGAWVILFPSLSFTLHGMEIPKYVEIWQCVGMIVGVYGLGYIAAASDPIKHWPIVMVGFLGKILGPIGFAQALYNEVFPISFMFNIVFNDLIWWIPFFMMLKDAYKMNIESSSPTDPVKISDMNIPAKSVVVALRHQGCTFTRVVLTDLRKHKEAIETNGYSVVIIHMSTNEEMKPFIYGFIDKDIILISDPKAAFYQALGLNKASLPEVFGLREFLFGITAFFKGHGLGPLRGNGFQLGGIFKIDNNQISSAHRATRASERYKFDELFKY